MAQKSKSVYICSECGYETPRWLGQCPNCNEWNTLEEKTESSVSTPSGNTLNLTSGKKLKNISAIVLKM